MNVFSSKMTQPPKTSRLLIPQYTLRWLLAMTTLVALVFSIIAVGLGGSKWAAAVSVAIVSLVIMMLVYASAFTLVWLFSVVTSAIDRRKAGRGQSPFGDVS